MTDNKIENTHLNIDLEIVNHIYQKFHEVIVADSIGAIIFVGLLWNAIDHQILFFWFVPELIINGLCRHILAFSYFRHAKHHKYDNLPFWHNAYAFSLFVSGLFWSAAGCLFVFTPDPVYRIVIMLYLVGITGAGILSIIPSKRSCLAFTIPIAIAMLLISFSFSNIFSIGLTFSVVIFIISSLISAFSSSETLINSFELQFHNLKLANDLSASHAQLEQSYVNLHESENTLRLVQENSPIGMAMVSLSSKWVQVNKALCDLFGFSEAELKGRSLQSVTHPDDFSIYLENINKLLQGKITSFQIENRYIRKHGSNIWVLVNVFLIRTKQQKPRYLIAQVLNIDERKRYEKYLSETGKMNDMFQMCHSSVEAYAISKNFAEVIFPGFSGGLCIRKRSFNKDFVVVAQWGNQHLLKKVFTSEDCWALRGASVYTPETHSSKLICNHFNESPSGEYICIPMVVEGETFGFINFMDPDGKKISETVKKNMINFVEANKLALANIRLREIIRDQAIHDPLTGLYNRRYLMETLPEKLIKISRENTKLCVAMLDLDFFKRINDNYGHDAGDEVLKHTGDLLKMKFRNNDICYRYGGEEFIILIDIDLTVALPRLEQLRSDMEQANIQYQDLTLPKITISIGVAEAPSHGSTVESIIHMADKALYEAKRSGRNKVVVAKPTVCDTFNP